LSIGARKILNISMIIEFILLKGEWPLQAMSGKCEQDLRERDRRRCISAQ